MFSVTQFISFRCGLFSACRLRSTCSLWLRKLRIDNVQHLLSEYSGQLCNVTYPITHTYYTYIVFVCLNGHCVMDDRYALPPAHTLHLVSTYRLSKSNANLSAYYVFECFLYRKHVLLLHAGLPQEQTPRLESGFCGLPCRWDLHQNSPWTPAAVKQPPSEIFLPATILMRKCIFYLASSSNLCVRAQIGSHSHASL